MHIAICDDDVKFAEELKALTQKGFAALNAQAVVSLYHDGVSFVSEISEFDAVFLDIDMPDVNGFEIAEKINHADKCFIIFVTSYDELVYSSIKFQPFRFIRKSHLERELPEALRALNKAVQKRTAGKRFKLHTRTMDVFLNVSEIKYIETFGHWLRVYINDKELLECYGSLTKMEEQLSDFDFIRTHKSYLVNCRYIYTIGKGRIILTDKTEIPLSRYKSNVVRNKVKQYILSEL